MDKDQLKVEVLKIMLVYHSCVLITTAEREQDLFLFHKLSSDESGISQLVFRALDKHQLKVEVLKRMFSLPLLVY